MATFKLGKRNASLGRQLCGPGLRHMFTPPKALQWTD